MGRTLYDELHEERLRQTELWGGYEHDTLHSPAEWHDLISNYSLEAMGVQVRSIRRKKLLAVAALALAAIEVMDEQDRVALLIEEAIRGSDG